MAVELKLIALEGVPLVQPGEDLVGIVLTALSQNKVQLVAGDVLIVAQKIVSKAEGRLVDLVAIEPSPAALTLATEIDKDPRLVDLILRQSNEIVRHKLGVLVVEQQLGLVMANAGIDASNVEGGDDSEMVLLLPEDPDKSAAALRTGVTESTGVEIGVIVADSIGRAWRNGTVGHAIGVAGLPAVADLRGELDLFGRELRVSEQAVADELAAAASLLHGQAAEGLPLVLARGFTSSAPHQTAKDLLRPKKMDMFR